MRKLLLSVMFLSSFITGSYSQPFTYQNPNASFEERAEDIVSRMTLDEKISQMMDVAPAIPRLNIQAYNWWNEGLHGVARAGVATVFPQAIGLAAMWNDSLQYRIATATSDEFRAKYNEAQKAGDYGRYKGLTVWSPNINIFRDPRWGRGQETYGEDPFLTTRYGVAFVKGLQGNDPKYLKTVATPKHFAVHSGPEKLRHVFDINVSEHDFIDTYTPAFEACVKEGKAYSIMSAYNRFRGKSCTADDLLLNKLARNQWGFNGYVVSDCDAVADIFQTHKITGSMEEAAALAVKSGCDLNCGDAYSALKKAVEKGLITEKEIDESVKRLMVARLKLGIFDNQTTTPFSNIPLSKIDCPEHKALALKAAQQSLVLLKNDNVLPLNKRVLNKIAIVGPNSNDAEVMFGNYNGTPSRAVSPLEAMRKALLAKTKIYYNELHSLVSDKPALKAIQAIAFENEGKKGLKAEYFNNKELNGQPALTRIDSTIDFNWDGGIPAPGISRTNMSVRWTGNLIASETGEYSFGFSGDDGFRVWLDGALAIESWKRQGTTLIQKNFNFKKGEKHTLKVEYFQGEYGAEARLLWSFNDPKALDKAMDEIAQCDIILYFGGLSPKLEGEEMNVPYDGFDGGDRTKIDLPKAQIDVLKKLKKTGKPVVFVVMAGSAIAMNWENENLDAILYAWYPGQDGGTAIAGAIMGEFSPAGRLPVTFYKSIDQLPPFENYDMKGRTYRYFKGEPLYPFGYGLSYSEFTYSGITAPSLIKAGEKAKIKVNILNSGKRASDEVVQLYVRHPATNLPVPIQSLKGFKRIFLKAGERTTVEFELDARSMAILDTDNKLKVMTGDIDVLIGGQQPSAKLIKEGKIQIATISKSGETYLVK